MLSHNCIGPEDSCIQVMNMVAMNGNAPNMILIDLYLPVRCIHHPANIDPIDIEMLFGNR